MRANLRLIKGVCPHDCPDTCGFVTTVDESTGKAINLRGDRDHPFTRGFLCRKVNHYLERVYHPERLKYPQRRRGHKGEGQFERITWDEAIRTIAQRLKTIAASESGPQAIMPYSYAGTMGKIQGSSLDRRFFHRLGASLLDRTICATAGAAGCDITLGTRAFCDPEAVIHSRFIINWGSNTAVTNIHFWTLQHQARKQGAKIVTIDPYRSPTAAKSDQWLAIRPGTDAALALGVMHHIFANNWQDDDYLHRYCIGVDELRDRVLKQYPLEKVASITGIDANTIASFAEEYRWSYRDRGGPALIRLNYGLQRHGGGAMAVRTITCLPAITGDWRYPGGGAFLSTSKLYPFNTHYLERPDLIPPGTRSINMVQLAEALLGELPGPPIKALFVYNSNPAAVCPDQNRVRRGLSREDLFTVVHEQFLTDTALFADILLPATTQLEHFDLHGSYGHFYVQANNPAIAPLEEAKPNTEVFRLLAREMGFEPDLFEISDEELASQALQGYGDLGSHQCNQFDLNGFSGISLDSLKAGPVRMHLPKDWAPFAHGGFPTPSGKCELYSQQEALAGRDPLPYYKPPHEDPQTRFDLAAKYPLQMICPPDSNFLNSTFVEVEALRRQAGEPRLEIHPSDAAPRGIADGQRIVIFNDRGRFYAQARVNDGIKPGVVITFGIWWSRYTPDGVNCNTTTSTALTDLGGGATFFDNLVEVQSA